MIYSFFFLDFILKCLNKFYKLQYPIFDIELNKLKGEFTALDFIVCAWILFLYKRKNCKKISSDFVICISRFVLLFFAFQYLVILQFHASRFVLFFVSNQHSILFCFIILCFNLWYSLLYWSSVLKNLIYSLSTRHCYRICQYLIELINCDNDTKHISLKYNKK